MEFRSARLRHHVWFALCPRNPVLDLFGSRAIGIRWETITSGTPVIGPALRTLLRGGLPPDMKGAATSLDIGTAMPGAGTMTTIGIGIAIRTSGKTITAEGVDTIIAERDG